MPSRESRNQRSWMRDPFLFTLALLSLACTTIALAITRDCSLTLASSCRSNY